MILSLLLKNKRKENGGEEKKGEGNPLPMPNDDSYLIHSLHRSIINLYSVLDAIQ